MTNENFFKHDDKAYAENLNDAILIANAFDYEVPVKLPEMYNNNHYPNNNNIHKVGVADVTIISSGSLSIGDTSITNNANTSQVLRLRVYPNFNNFFSWKDLRWTATGAITIDICDAGTTTSLLPAGELTNPEGNRLSGIANLQGLKEYDLLITIPTNGILNTLSIVFVNNWNSQNRVSASISAANVSGLVDDLNEINTSIESLNSQVSPLEVYVPPTKITPAFPSVVNNIYYMRRGNIGVLYGDINIPAETELSSPLLTTLPSEVTPAYQFDCLVFQGSGSYPLRMNVKGATGINAGQVTIYGSVIGSSLLRVYAVWICKGD